MIDRSSQLNTERKQVIRISVSPSSRWRASAAQRLLALLYSADVPIRLCINAQYNDVELVLQWYIEADRIDVFKLRQMIYEVYPAATVGIEPLHESNIGFFAFDLQAANPYIWPLKPVSEFTLQTPLNSFIEGCSVLFKDEQITYQLAIHQVPKQVLMLGQQVYDREQHKLADLEKDVMQEKLGMSLRSVELGLHIKACDRPRALQIAEALLPSMAIFDSWNKLAPGMESTFPLVLTSDEVASLWHLPNASLETQNIVWNSGQTAPLPPNLIIEEQGVFLGYNDHGGIAHHVYLEDTERENHVCIFGKARQGKTTLLHRLLNRDIASGKTVILVDPYGDLVSKVLESSVPNERIQNVLLLDTETPGTLPALNPLTVAENISLDLAAKKVSGALSTILDEQTQQDMQTQRTLNFAIQTLMHVPGALLTDIPKLLLDDVFRARVLKSIKNSGLLNFWQLEYSLAGFQLQIDQAQNVRDNIVGLCQNPTLRAILCEDDRPDFSEVFETGKSIVLVSLRDLKCDEKQIFTSFLLTKLQLVLIDKLGKGHLDSIYVYIDDVQDFASDLIARHIADVGQVGLSLVVASQSMNTATDQYLTELLPQTSVTISFGLDRSNAALIAPHIPPFSMEDLSCFRPFHAAMKMNHANADTPAFSITTQPPLLERSAVADIIEQLQTSDNNLLTSN